MGDQTLKKPFELLQEYLGLRRAGDADGAMERVHPDLELQIPDSLPWGGVRHGRDALLAIRAELQERLKIDPSGEVALLDAGDVAIISFNGQASGISTGTPCVYRTLEVYRFDEQLISRIDMFYFDTASMLNAMGIPLGGQ